MFWNIQKLWRNFGAKDVLVLLGAVAEIYAISLIFEISLTIDFVIFVLLIATFQYFYDSIKEYFKIKFTEQNMVNNKKVSHLIVFLIIVIALMVGIVYRFSNKFSLFFLLFLILLGLLYPIIFKKITKKIVGFKDIFVAIGWNLMIWFYFSYYGTAVSTGIFFFMIFVYTRDLINASFCDLKDMEEDRNKGLKTFANYFGKKKLIIYLQIINLISILILILGFYFKLIPSLAIFLLIPICLTGIFILISEKIKKFPAFVVDLEYIFWAVVILVAMKIFD